MIAPTPGPARRRCRNSQHDALLPLRLVIFDCDGVLVDSEGPSNRIVAEEVTALGWPMTYEESCERFVGGRLSDIPPVVEPRIGRAVPDDWVDRLRARIVAALAADVEPIPGAAAALQAVAALGLAMRVASNSSHEEMAVKFDRTGLAHLVRDRLHSARDVARGKPAPDLFLHAAAAAGVPAGACLVVEDSVPGAAAARAAGMACVALAPLGASALLLATGAVPIRSLDELPALLRQAMRAAA